MIATPCKPQFYKGVNASASPTTVEEGIFSFCSGGVPQQGSFARVPGKSLRNSGSLTGGVISIYQLSTSIVIQRFTGIEILDIKELAPNSQDFVTDSFGNLVYDNQGIPVTQ